MPTGAVSNIFSILDLMAAISAHDWAFWGLFVLTRKLDHSALTSLAEVWRVLRLPLCIWSILDVESHVHMPKD